MSIKTKRRLSRFANGLEAIVFTSIRNFASGVELFLIDLVFGKAKYRKRERQPRQPRVRRTVYHEVIRPSAPRVYVVKQK